MQYVERNFYKFLLIKKEICAICRIKYLQQIIRGEEILMKKFLGSILAALLAVFMLGTTVSAAQLSLTDIESLVNSTNASIEQEITIAQTKANALTQKYDTIINVLQEAQRVLPSDSRAYNAVSAQIELAKSKYNAELDKLINELIQKTNAMANETIKIAGENGYTVICELKEVQIGDRIVLIDPLRVSDTIHE